MTKIECFILKVEVEATLALQSGIMPNADKEQLVLERLSEKFPEAGINPEEERKIAIHARLLLNARNN